MVPWFTKLLGLEKMKGGSHFKSLEVIGTKELMCSVIIQTHRMKENDINIKYQC